MRARSEAMKEMEKTAPTIRQKVITILTRSEYGLTADEIAAKIGRHYGSVRPRLTELKREGIVERVPNDHGKSTHGKIQHLWRMAF